MILANSNSINKGNSSHRSHLIAGGLLLGSRRVRGRPWLNAGAGKVPTWLLLASEPLYKDFTVAVFRRSPPLFSNRRCSVVRLPSP